MKKKLFLIIPFLLFGSLAMMSCEVQPDVEFPQVSKKEVHLFDGQISVGAIETEAYVHCLDDETFNLSVDNYPFKADGTYTFDSQSGFIFKFNDSTYSEIKTVYNFDTLEHQFTYKIDLDEGVNVDVLFRLYDKNFVPTTSEEKRSFLSKVCFTGKTINLTTAETLGINKIKLTPKGFCVLNFDKSLNKENINGSYEFVDNEFIFNIEGKKYKTVFDFATKTYTFDYVFASDEIKYEIKFSYSVLDSAFTWEGVITGIETTINLYLKDDKIAFFDLTFLGKKPEIAGSELDELFDLYGTWEIDEASNSYIVKVKKENQPEKIYISKYDKEHDEYYIDFEIESEFGLIPTKLIGKGYSKNSFSLEGAFKINGDDAKLTLEFLTDNKVRKFAKIAKNPALEADFEDTGTYELADKNIVNIHLNSFTEGEVLSTSWNELKGIYSANYKFKYDNEDYNCLLSAKIY